MIKPMVIGLGLIGAVKMTVQMPFTDMTGGVSLFFEQSSHSNFRITEMYRTILGKPSPYTITVWSTACEDGRAGG
jgi:chemotaxis methyl-accepting protein methylase